MFWVIISRQATEMQQELATAFPGRRDIRVILDRRYGQRRSEGRSVSQERRRQDRRQNLQLPLPRGSAGEGPGRRKGR